MRFAYLCLVTILGLALLGLGACFFYSSSEPSTETGSSESLNWWSWTPGDSVDNGLSLFTPGYRPDQPIKFDHSLHAGEYKVDCQYCHNGARRSPAAGIPPLNTCMGCHKYVNPNAPEIKLLKEKYDNNEPVEWVRVHDLPDFVRWSHEVHINAVDVNGKPLLNCESCHGNVKAMSIVEQIAPLQMGWCVECHNRVKKPAESGQPALTNAPVSCNTCHY